MKSTIRVDFQGPETSSQNGFEPVIRVNLVESDDTRDKLLKTFFQSLGGESSWLHVKHVKIDQSCHSGLINDSIVITPVKEADIENLKKEIEDRINDRGNIF